MLFRRDLKEVYLWMDGFLSSVGWSDSKQGSQGGCQQHPTADSVSDRRTWLSFSGPLGDSCAPWDQLHPTLHPRHGHLCPAFPTGMRHKPTPLLLPSSERPDVGRKVDSQGFFGLSGLSLPTPALPTHAYLRGLQG